LTEVILLTNDNQKINELRLSDLVFKIEDICSRISPYPQLALDVGAMGGHLQEKLQKKLNCTFVGVDPFLQNYSANLSPNAKLIKAWTFSLPFCPNTFDLVTFISVYEHIFPKERLLSINEISNVLKVGGTLIAQIPNMYFPIEIHSWLPLQQFLPRTIAFNFAKTFSLNSHNRGFGMDWYRVAIQDLVRKAELSSLQLVEIKSLNLPLELFPAIGKLAHYLGKLIPINYFCVFKKTHANKFVHNLTD
jgi:SAM-dependent methyltransferase